MKLLNNDKGYTLLFTFGLLVLFSILGIALFTFTSSGLSRNEVRENTSQSNDLAENGIVYFTQLLNKNLENKMPTITDSSKIKPIFNNYGKTYGCPALVSVDNNASEISKLTEQNSKEITSETGKSKICISKIEKGSSEYSRLLTFKSIGNAGDTKKTHYAQAEIGYKFIPGVLNYAVSTNKGGNLYLFGGSEIMGNVKVAGKMYTHQKAFWSNTNKPKWIGSVLPRIISTTSDSNNRANIYVNNQEIYKFTSDLTPSGYITKTNPIIPSNTVQTVKQSNIHTGLFLKSGESGPNLQAGKPDNLTLNIKEKVEAVGSSVGNTYKGTEILPAINTLNGANGQIGAVSEKIVAEGSALYLRENMRIGRFSTNGNGSNNPRDYYDFRLNGNYYVNGNVVISGAKLKGNAVLYVKGSVDIEFSTINENDPNNTLFIFAEGPIEIHNISVNSNPGKGSIINGFFYSNSNFLMYGVGSNTKITGGVSAVNTTFTALRGHSVDRIKENRSSATDLTSTDPNPINACEKNEEDSDGREGNYEYMFEMANKTLLNEYLNQLSNRGYWRKNGHFMQWQYHMGIEFNSGKNKLSNSELSNLIELLNNPLGNKQRTATEKDKGKELYVNSFLWGWIKSPIYFTGIKVKDFHINDSTMRGILENTRSLLYNWKDFNGTEYKYSGATSSNTINFSENETTEIQRTFTLLYNVLNDLYGDGNSISEDECADWREEINTGGNSSNLPSHTIGGVNYSSRLTIIYDEELITRYLDTNEIQLENTEISVLPGTVKSLSIE